MGATMPYGLFRRDPLPTLPVVPKKTDIPAPASLPTLPRLAGLPGCMEERLQTGLRALNMNSHWQIG
jgi:hypothetical protein